MRSNPVTTVARFCARPVLCWLAFPSAPALGSTVLPRRIAPRCSPASQLLRRGPDFSRSCIIGLRLLTFPMRTLGGKRAHRSNVRPPRFRRVPFVRDVFFEPRQSVSPSHRGTRTCCPSTLLTARPLRFYGFRGSMAHPTQSLCTLRNPPSPATTQHSLPGARYGLPDRSLTGRTTPAFLAHKQSILSLRRNGLLRFARNDGEGAFTPPDQWQRFVALETDKAGRATPRRARPQASDCPS